MMQAPIPLGDLHREYSLIRHEIDHVVRTTHSFSASLVAA